MVPVRGGQRSRRGAQAAARAHDARGTTACALAAEGGHLEYLRGARAIAARHRENQGAAEWARMAAWDKAARCAAEVLKWARAHDCPWDEGACASRRRAASSEVLKWLRAARVDTCTYAAQGGHLDA